MVVNKAPNKDEWIATKDAERTEAFSNLGEAIREYARAMDQNDYGRMQAMQAVLDILGCPGIGPHVLRDEYRRRFCDVQSS